MQVCAYDNELADKSAEPRNGLRYPLPRLSITTNSLRVVVDRLYNLGNPKKARSQYVWEK